VADEDDPVWQVRQHFQTALGRAPEPSEHFFWAKRLLECGDNAACIASAHAILSAPSIVQFSSASYQSDEGDARATLNIVRTGNTSVESSFTFNTVSDQGQVPCLKFVGGASFRCDYVQIAATYTFAPGETQKNIPVPLIDDTHVEGTETLQLRLRSVGDSTALGAIHTAVLSITDNDIEGNLGEPNPIFSTPFFVRIQYLDFLSREPEAGEPWSEVLNGCSDVNNNPACDRISVSAAFFRSQEFRLKGFYAFNHYRVAFDRRPAYESFLT
jgi:hypothetical protein